METEKLLSPWSKSDLYFIRAMIRGLAEEKRILKKRKKPNFRISSLKRKSRVLHLVYGMLRGKSFLEMEKNIPPNLWRLSYFIRENLNGLVRAGFLNPPTLRHRDLATDTNEKTIESWINGKQLFATKGKDV